MKLSINDFVSFIQDFTIPHESHNELWKVESDPFIVIHLSIHKKAKKSKDTKKKTDKKIKEEEKEEKKEEDDEEDDKNRVIFNPSLPDCKNFIMNSMEMIIESTNQINDLESDLMPFLQKQGQSNFKIDSNFPWIKEATEKLNSLFTDNSPQPAELLENFKKFEYIMNINKKDMVDSLFKKGENKEEKATLAEIKEQATHFENAYMEIMTLAEDEVNFKLFRVITKKLKNELAE